MKNHLQRPNDHIKILSKKKKKKISVNLLSDSSLYLFRYAIYRYVLLYINEVTLHIVLFDLLLLLNINIYI